MHRAATPFEIVFLTNFSDACFRAIPALAQLADDIDVRLTLLHACGADVGRYAARTEDIRSFFAEADHYPACRRLVTAESTLDALRRLQAETPIDLVVAPAGDPLGLPRIGHSSLRSRLIQEIAAPVWTCGHEVPARRLARATRHVACVLEVSQHGLAHVRLASTYASRMNARLHLVQVIPDIDESSLLLAYDDWSTDKARRAAIAAGAGELLEEAVRVTDRRGLAQTLRACDADIALLDGQPWITRQWLADRVNPTLDALPCPVIAVPSGHRDLAWQLNPSRRIVAPAALRATGEQQPALSPVN